MSGHRGTQLVLIGAVLGALALGIPVLTREPAAVSAPEPVTPPTATASPPSTVATGSTTSVSAPDPAPPATERPPERPSSGRPTSSARPTATSSGKQAASFRAVAGPACPVTATQSTRSSAGWDVVPGDSWTGDGCADRFLYAAPGDPNYVQWQFTFTAPDARTCHIEVFVPDSPLAQALARYGVAATGFTVDQKAGRGKWVHAATVSVDAASLVIHLDGDQGNTGVTAAPLRVTCV